MKVNSISGITCSVDDLDRTAQFYETIGFRRGKEEDDRVTFYVNWFFMTFIAASGERTEGTGRGEGLRVCVKVESADEFYEGVRSKGFEPEGEPDKGAVGREFVLKDPDGYELVFFEK